MKRINFNYTLFLIFFLCVNTNICRAFLAQNTAYNKISNTAKNVTIDSNKKEAVDSTIALYRAQLGMYHRHGKNANFLYSSSKLIKLASKNQHYNAEVYAYLRLVNMYYYIPNFKKVSHYLKLCKTNKTYSKELKGINLFHYYDGYAMLYWSLHDTKKYKTYNALALDVAKKINNNNCIIKKTIDIAWQHQEEGDIDLSAAYIMQAKNNLLYNSDSSFHHYINIIWCDNYYPIPTKLVTTIQKIAQQALNFMIKNNELSHCNKALSTLNTVYEQQGNYTKAQECCSQMLSITRSIKNNIGMEIIFNEKYEIAKLQADYKNASVFLDSAYTYKLKNNEIGQITQLNNENEKEQARSLLIIKQLTYKGELKNNKYVFIIITLTLILAVGVMIFYYTKKITKNKLQQALLNQQLLRSQMNPHFTFNSLNTLQYFILNKEEDKAIDYLSSFSKLIRYSLNQSLNEKTTLSQELFFLNLYMELECKRYGNKNIFVINVAPSINTQKIKIPQMLLQPFIENAFNHGLKHKIGNGEITITITDHNLKVLLCTITDNGVGRTAAKEFNTLKKHASKALEIVTERLYLFNKLERNGTKYSFDIIDIISPQKDALGTTVKIIIPYD
jgi:hypothetical protein